VGALPVIGDGTTGVADPAGLLPIPFVNPVELGLLSDAAFGTPLLWKQLLLYNDIDDPLHFTGPLAVPPLGEAP
jgi:hypothetical protein